MILFICGDFIFWPFINHPTTLKLYHCSFVNPLHYYWFDWVIVYFIAHLIYQWNSGFFISIRGPFYLELPWKKIRTFAKVSNLNFHAQYHLFRTPFFYLNYWCERKSFIVLMEQLPGRNFLAWLNSFWVNIKPPNNLFPDCIWFC